ncbi:MAG: SRPBCC family protein [Flavobacteriales bacterium]
MNATTYVTVNGGTTIRSTALISRNCNEVWNIVSDPGNIVRFHPLIKHSECISKNKSGIGSERLCKLLPMGEMIEQATEWKEGQGYTMLVKGGKMMPPVKFMKGALSLDHREGRCLVSFEFSYKLKGGFLGALMDRFMIRPQFRKAPPKYVLGLKYYAENGRKISKKELAQLGF